jgi:hypothetical protein
MIPLKGGVHLFCIIFCQVMSQKSFCTKIFPSYMYFIQNQFVSDLRQLGGFLRVLRFPPPNTDRLDITEILLKVVLNTITLTHAKS